MCPPAGASVLPQPTPSSLTLTPEYFRMMMMTTKTLTEWISHDRTHDRTPHQSRAQENQGQEEQEHDEEEQEEDEEDAEEEEDDCSLLLHEANQLMDDGDVDDYDPEDEANLPEDEDNNDDVVDTRRNSRGNSRVNRPNRPLTSDAPPPLDDDSRDTIIKRMSEPFFIPEDDLSILAGGPTACGPNGIQLKIMDAYLNVFYVLFQDVKCISVEDSSTIGREAYKCRGKDTEEAFLARSVKLRSLDITNSQRVLILITRSDIWAVILKPLLPLIGISNAQGGRARSGNAAPARDTEPDDVEDD
ncbi:hypothetical protein MBLNU457_3269t1 [Dothideomycetes sp. NU457]